ncbi:hypothetical protein ACGFZP_16295 [Kitasatospora sp. NPDC048239]|uniref:hypothetical protein n=1 Tax=Kitasatospora sp. NPDC048239 TaxID=3364046 RepID=UPI00371E7800
MGRTARLGGTAIRCALAVLLAAVLALLTGAGTADSLHRLALDRCTTTGELPGAPAVPFDGDDCPEPGERRRDHGNAPAGASTDRVGHSRGPLPGLLPPGPRPAAGPAPGASPGPAADRQAERARPDAGRGVVLRC